MSGIYDISPEVHSLILFKESPVTLHGITTNFSRLTKSETVDGIGLVEANENQLTHGIFAGKSIAEILKLEVGNKYLMYSTISESYATFALLGIVSFDSFYDEEIFTSLANGKFFRPSTSKNDISMLRFKFDESIISRERINGIVNNDHLVKIKLNSQSGLTGDLSGITVSVYTFNGIKVMSNQTDSAGITYFNLPLGHYTFIVSNSRFSFSFDQFVLESMELSKSLPDYFRYYGSQSFYNITIKLFYDSVQVFNAKINLISKYGESLLVNKTNNQYLLFNIPGNRYTVIAKYNNLIEEFDVILNSNKDLIINFTHETKLTLKDNNDNIITGYSCSIYNYNTNLSINYQNCPENLYLPKSVYKWTFNPTSFNENSKIFIIEGQSTIQEIIGVVGSVQYNFTFLDIDNSPSIFQKVFMRPSESENYVETGTTDLNGEIDISIPLDSKYIILINNSIQSNSFEIKGDYNKNKTVILNKLNKFSFFIYNNSNSLETPIKNVFFSIQMENGDIIQKNTSNSGFVQFEFVGEQYFKGFILFKDFKKNFTLNSLDLENITNIPVGHSNVLFSLKSDYNIPLEGAEILVYSNDNTDTYISNELGQLDIFVPTSFQKSILEEFNLYESFNKIFLSMDPSKLNQFGYLIIIKVQNVEKKLFIPMTMFSNNINLDLKIPFIILSQITFEDIIGFKIRNAIIRVSSEINGVQLIKISNSVGIASFYIYYEGDYFIEIKYNGETFTENLFINKSNTDFTINLPVFSSNVKFSNSWRVDYSAVSGKEFLDNFYSSSISFFIQIAAVMILIVITILLFLFSSAIMFVFESIQSEIAILQIIGSSNNQTASNIVYQLQLRAFLASIVGYILGYLVTLILPSFKNIEIIGFVIQPALKIEFFILNITVINILIFIVLINSVKNYDWNNLLGYVKF